MSGVTAPSEPPNDPVAIPQTLGELLRARLDWTTRYGLLVSALALTGTVVGSALSPYLLATQPLWLVLLSPIPRHMVMVAPSLDLHTYVIAGAARRIFATSGGVCLGLRFGEAGVAWVESHDGNFRRGARTLRWAFRRAGLFVVFVSPNPFVTGTAVAMGASPRAVMAISSLGHIAWLLVWHRFGDLLSRWITPVVAFFSQYRWESTAVSVVAVALYYGLKLARRTSG